MKLYHSPTSPYARKIMVLLHETGQLDDVALEPAQTSPTNPTPGLASKNPLMKIPALERADGATLFDSRVICAFFDDRAEAGFYGQRTQGQWVWQDGRKGRCAFKAQPDHLWEQQNDGCHRL